MPETSCSYRRSETMPRGSCAYPSGPGMINGTSARRSRRAGNGCGRRSSWISGSADGGGIEKPNGRRLGPESGGPAAVGPPGGRSGPGLVEGPSVELAAFPVDPLGRARDRRATIRPFAHREGRSEWSAVDLLPFEPALRTVAPIDPRAGTAAWAWREIEPIRSSRPNGGARPRRPDAAHTTPPAPRGRCRRCGRKLLPYRSSPRACARGHVTGSGRRGATCQPVVDALGASNSRFSGAKGRRGRRPARWGQCSAHECRTGAVPPVPRNATPDPRPRSRTRVGPPPPASSLLARARRKAQLAAGHELAHRPFRLRTRVSCSFLLGWVSTGLLLPCWRGGGVIVSYPL